MTADETVAALETQMYSAALGENINEILPVLRAMQALNGWPGQATSMAYCLLAGLLIAEGAPPAIAEQVLEQQIEFMRAAFARARP